MDDLRLLWVNVIALKAMLHLSFKAEHDEAPYKEQYLQHRQMDFLNAMGEMKIHGLGEDEAISLKKDAYVEIARMLNSFRPKPAA